MRTRFWRLVGVLALIHSGTASLKAAETASSAKTEAAGSNELAEGSQASADDGMSKSRFGEDEDDTYTDDSEHLDDLSRSKFTDEKKDDDQDMDGMDQDDR